MPKFICREGHLHNEQWRADNCAACKRNERRRTQRLMERYMRSPQLLADIEMVLQKCFILDVDT